jgi:hypothetical protein
MRFAFGTKELPVNKSCFCERCKEMSVLHKNYAVTSSKLALVIKNN